MKWSQTSYCKHFEIVYLEISHCVVSFVFQ